MSDVSEFLNKYRVFPRAQLVFWGVLVWDVSQWAMGLGDVSTGQAAIVSTVFLAGAGYGKIYGDTDPGKKADKGV